MTTPFSPTKLVNCATPRHRNVFGTASPNLMSQQRSSIYDSKKVISPNFNVVLSDWTLSNGRVNMEKGSKIVYSSSAFEDGSSSSNNSNNVNGSPKKLRRTNTGEILDRFIPSRHTTSGKLTLEDALPLPSALPYDHIASQTSQIYKDTVAEACGLEVGERILQFQPVPPQSKKVTKLKKTNSFKTKPTISTAAAQARIKRLPTCPDKVLDAPGLVDDFYLNLLSWSSENILAIALENCVYYWNATTGAVDVAAECHTIVTSVRWSDNGLYLSIGLDDGSIEIWDVETNSKLRSMSGHDTRVGAQSWNEHILTSGSRSGQMYNHDVRISQHIIAELNNHTAEVCGIEWRSDGLQLASGGNDNVVNIWDARSSIPQFTKTAHTAAVKALAWCPTQMSFLATGGGSSCKKIHFWNTVTGARVNTIETESQVSSLNWGYANGIGKEIVATHGFPHNDISIYSYPSLQKTGVVIGAHESRVLHSSLSPDGTTLATVAADENLKFWKIFDLVSEAKQDSLSSADKGMGKVMTIR
ncbi:hypothetical protein CANARDRAFT_27811 [[Candida] arabinofermentans NRRL YB-2248]|uniref:CDC20/Fizzy WD40 domain-containing protein n=1 Tax=[Candida] arabinofermentans NRRL YB-2248 TaxID=983967 RepID=A0A1E4T1W3_9ASCO|nr:hypothetical protein CANARDRAFT_27811 [[Candida] arabinofermentans NRRL YB-2248]